MPHKGLVVILFLQVLLIPASFTPLSDLIRTHPFETCKRSAEFKPNTILIRRQALSAGGFFRGLPVPSLNECYFACCSVAACTGAVFKSKSPKECLFFSCAHDNDCTYESRDKYDVILFSHRISGIHHVGVGEHCGPTKICHTNHTVCSDGQCECQSGYIRKNSACVQSVCQSPQLQFQCADSSTCVAIYDKCNGIVECPDGSDEVGCPLSTHLHVAPGSLLEDSYDRFHLPGTRDEMNRTSELQRSSLERDFTISTRSPVRVHKTLPNFHDYPDVRNPKNWRLEAEYWHDRDPIVALGGGSPDYDLNSDGQHNMLFFKQKSPPFVFGHHQTRSSALNFDGDAWDRSDLWGPSPHQFDYMRSVSSYGRPHRGRTSSIYSLNNFDSPHIPDETESSRFRDPSVNFLDDVLPSYPKPYPLLDPNDDTRLYRRNSFPDNSKMEELIDPSVLRGSRTQGRDMSGGAGDTLHRRTISSARDGVRVGQKGPEYALSKNSVGASSGPVQLTSNAASTLGDTVLNVLGRSRSEGHTSALILAFSLGLVCCFVVLLIFEWRRRTRTSTWAMRRRPAKLPVLFNERGKPAAVSLRSDRRPKTAIRAMTNPTGSDEEAEALCNGLIL